MLKKKIVHIISNQRHSISSGNQLFSNGNMSFPNRSVQFSNRSQIAYEQNHTNSEQQYIIFLQKGIAAMYTDMMACTQIGAIYKDMLTYTKICCHIHGDADIYTEMLQYIYIYRFAVILFFCIRLFICSFYVIDVDSVLYCFRVFVSISVSFCVCLSHFLLSCVSLPRPVCF